MMQQQYICKNCVLIDGSFGIELNSEGVCNYCEDPTYKTTNWWKIQITDEAKEAGLKDWNSVIESLRSRQGERKYDCLVGYSGGKDSTALLYKMVYDYSFNPLAVTIDSGFMPEVAFENMRDTLEKLKIDHVVIDGAKETFIKLYQWVFANQGSGELTLTRNLCDNCGDLVHSLVVREAMERDIDLILFGYSPDEIRRYFYEIPRDEIVNDWLPDFISEESFTKEDRKQYFPREDFEDRVVPRILLPYHVIDYSEEKIIELIESKNLVKKGNSNTLKTSCHIIAAAVFYDLNRFGALPYARKKEGTWEDLNLSSLDSYQTQNLFELSEARENPIYRVQEVKSNEVVLINIATKKTVKLLASRKYSPQTIYFHNQYKPQVKAYKKTDLNEFF